MATAFPQCSFCTIGKLSNGNTLYRLNMNFADKRKARAAKKGALVNSFGGKTRPSVCSTATYPDPFMSSTTPLIPSGRVDGREAEESRDRTGTLLQSLLAQAFTVV